jgi:hypothetical protein
LREGVRERERKRERGRGCAEESLILRTHLQFGAVEFAVEEAVVEPVYSNVAVLSSAGIDLTIGRDGNGVERPKMTWQGGTFLFEHLVPESRFKLSLTCACRSDIHGFLTTSKNHIWPGRVQGGTVERRLCCVRFDDLERLGVDELDMQKKRKGAVSVTHFYHQHTLQSFPLSLSLARALSLTFADLSFELVTK